MRRAVATELGETLTWMTEESGERLLRNSIVCYLYWFCYMEVDQYVELKGSDLCSRACQSGVQCGEHMYSYTTACACIAAIVYIKEVH